jgi:hypothetical protein
MRRTGVARTIHEGRRQMFDVEPLQGDYEPSQHRLVIDDGTVAVYYTMEPSPLQWVAVGTLSTVDHTGRPSRTCRMLVGCGRTEDAAISDLVQRTTKRLASPAHCPNTASISDQMPVLGEPEGANLAGCVA